MILQTLKLNNRTTQSRVKSAMSRPLLLRRAAMKGTIEELWYGTLTGSALLFGIGNAFDSVVSLVAYAFLLRKEKINILKVE